MIVSQEPFIKPVRKEGFFGFVLRLVLCTKLSVYSKGQAACECNAHSKINVKPWHLNSNMFA